MSSPLLSVSALAIIVFASFQAEAYVLFGYRWPGSHPRVPFYVSTNLAGHVPYAGNGTFEDGVGAITNAAHNWNIQGASGLRFVYAGTTEVTNAANDGINAVVFDPRPCPYAGTGCTGETIFYRGGDDTYEGFDIILYGSRPDGVPIQWTAQNLFGIHQQDIQTMVLHELGHVAGLDHSQIQSVMQTGCGNGCKRRNVTTDDRDGLQALYGPHITDGLWLSLTNVLPGRGVTLYLDYRRAAGQSYQIVADFDGVSTGWDLHTSWPSDSRMLSIDRCPYPAGSREPTPLEDRILSTTTGTLDETGQAQVHISVPWDLSCFPTNRQWHFSVVTYGTNPPSYIEDVGVAVTLNIQTPPAQPVQARILNRAFGLVELRWLSFANYAHQVESSATLEDWAAFGPPLPAAAENGWRTSVVHAAQSPLFYRVREWASLGPWCDGGELALVVSTNLVSVPEGGTASFSVKLNSPPSGTVFIEIARTGGDENLVIDGSDQHIFFSNDWNVPKVFTVRAASDSDAINSMATFTIKRTGGSGGVISSVAVTAVEADDDL